MPNDACAYTNITYLTKNIDVCPKTLVDTTCYKMLLNYNLNINIFVTKIFRNKILIAFQKVYPG